MVNYNLTEIRKATNKIIINQDNREQLPLARQGVFDSQYRNSMSRSFFHEAFRTNSLVFSAMDFRIQFLQLAKPCLYNVNNPDVEIEDNGNIPLYTLLKNPFPNGDFTQLIGMLEEYRILGGNSYLVALRNGKGEIESLTPFDSTDVRPIANFSKWVDHFEYDTGEQQPTKFACSEVCMFRWISAVNPLKPYLSFSPLESCGIMIDIDNKASQLEKNSLNNGASPSYVITTNQDASDISPVQAESISDGLRTKFEGANVSRVALMPFGSKLEKLSNDYKDWSTTNFRETPELRLASALGIPAMLLGMKSSEGQKTYSNLQEAQKNFALNMKRVMNYYSEILTKFFLKEGFVNDKNQYLIKFNWNDVPEMQEDITESTAYYLWNANAITLWQFQDAVGQPLDPDPEKGKLYNVELMAGAKPTPQTPVAI